MYLSGRQAPDFRTMGEITAIFNQVVELCVELGMVAGEIVFCDCTKIRANTSVKHGKTGEQLEKEIIHLKEEAREMLEEANNTDGKEDSIFGNSNPYTGDEKFSSILNHIETLERTYEEIEGEEAEAGEKEASVDDPTDPPGNEKEQNKEKEPKINTTDFDANIMKFSDKTLCPAYNGEVTVDGEENVIVACHLTDEAIDHQQLQPLVEHTQDNGIHPHNLRTDAGFFNYDNASYLEEKGITGYIPDNLGVH